MLVTGDDLARIARALDVVPWQFTIVVEAPQGDAMGFALDASASRYRLALARTALGDAAPACTFLIRAKGGAARCGLGALRPAPCRSFPAQLIDGTVVLDASSCTCGWETVVPDSGDGDRLRDEAAARATERRLITAWNSYVEAAIAKEPGARFEARDVCRYLLDRYESVA